MSRSHYVSLAVFLLYFSPAIPIANLIKTRGFARTASETLSKYGQRSVREVVAPRISNVIGAKVHTFIVSLGKK